MSGNSCDRTSCPIASSTDTRRSSPPLARLGTASSPIQLGLPQSEPANGPLSIMTKGGWYNAEAAPGRRAELALGGRVDRRGVGSTALYRSRQEAGPSPPRRTRLGGGSP